MYKRQSKNIWIGSLVISAIVLLQMSIYILSMFACWNVRFNLVASCHSWIRAIGLSYLETFLDVFVIYTLLFLGWKIGTHWFHAMRMKKRFELYKENILTNNMNKTFNSEETEFMVISHPAAIAITMGLARPRIVLSTGLMNLLNDDELTAVIYHEMYHKKCRDPLKNFLMSLCSSTLWYLPILKWFNRKYRIVNELLADEFAIEKQSTSVNLSSALVKMLKVGKRERIPFVHAPFADTSVNYRIEYLLNPHQEIQFRFPRKVALVSLAVFSLICMVFIHALA